MCVYVCVCCVCVCTRWYARARVCICKGSFHQGATKRARKVNRRPSVDVPAAVNWSLRLVYGATDSYRGLPCPSTRRVTSSVGTSIGLSVCTLRTKSKRANYGSESVQSYRAELYEITIFADVSFLCRYVVTAAFRQTIHKGG